MGWVRSKQIDVTFNLSALSCFCPAEPDIRAEPGQNVTLPCRAPASSQPIRALEWIRTDLKSRCVLFYRDGHFDPHCQPPSYQERAELQDRQMKDGDVSLLLQNVSTEDSGTYECRVHDQTRKRDNRAVLTSDPISIIYLDVAPPTPTGKAVS